MSVVGALALSLPLCATPVQTATSTTTGGLYNADISATDLINAGSPSLLSASVLPAYDTDWASSHLADGFTSTTDNSGATNGNTFFNASILAGSSNVAVYDLNTTLSPLGYRIDSVQSIAGFPTYNITHANQKFEIWTRSVGAPGYVLKATVDYSPFPTGGQSPGESKVVITDDAGPLATGVESIRLVFLPALQNGGIVPGTVFREIDVAGAALSTAPLAVSSPLPRLVVQRDGNGFGTIPVSGTYSGTPDRVEARVVVMAGGSNNGTSSDWETIDDTLSAGTYSGTLYGVAQGGWYELQVRTITNDVPNPVVSVQRVGVGDIYITAGQSNAASWGSPAATATDDRVSALHSGTGVWSLATDPMPYSDGTGGSPWTRLGDLLAAQENVPIAFACIAVGGTSIGQWNPTSGTLYPRFTAALSRFPASGFKAILWHQGEADSQSSTTKASMISGLQALIARTRTADGWNIPWYVAEASYFSTSSLGQEEPIAAAQRDVVAADAFTFRGSATDSFRQTGKLSDNVHFNSAGLLEHAQQWQRVLSGNTSPTITNPSFNQNGALTDGGIFFYSNTNTTSPTVIGWRILNANGDGASGSVAGYFNPNASFYANSADTINGGVLPGMNDKHCAFLFDGPSGSHFLQTLEATLQPSTRYTLTVALGVRSAGTFGGAKIELLADGQPVKGATFNTKSAVDTYRGSNSTGTFTDITVVFDSPVNPGAGQNLGIRLTKNGATSTYADFDNVRLTTVPNTGTVPVLMDFSSTSIGSSFGAISPSYQPLLATTGVSVNYKNIGIYSGGPDHTPSDLPNTGFNTFQYDGSSYTEPSTKPQIFSFSAPVTIESLWLSTFQGGTGTINIRAFADEAGTIPLGTVQTVIPLTGSNPIRWQRFTGLASAPYAGATRRIEFISSVTGGAGASSFTSNIQVDDILISAPVANTPYTEWVITNWGASNNANGSPGSDPDGDSILNGIEFHLGTSPLSVNNPPTPGAVSHSGKDWMRLSFAVDSSVNHTGFDILGSSTLTTWAPIVSALNGSIQVTKEPALWTIDIEKAYFPKYFFRLSASNAQ